MLNEEKDDWGNCSHEPCFASVYLGNEKKYLAEQGYYPFGEVVDGEYKYPERADDVYCSSCTSLIKEVLETVE